MVRDPIEAEVVRRFLAGEGVYAISASLREGETNGFWGQSEKRVEDILRRALKRRRKP